MSDNNHLAEVTKRLKTSSAVVPTLLFTLVCTPVGAAVASIQSGWIAGLFAAIAAMPVVLVFIQIAYFTFSDPDRLQNEEHVERKMVLARLEPQIGDRQRVIDLAGSGSIIENPKIGGGGSV